ncbi:MAG: lipopolysaccharide biosynthesis protein [Lachnospiraceae bacterium]|nr:lipopolysaccharide biosynthesis protein [Lachnospiraceae bacterium]
MNKNSNNLSIISGLLWKFGERIVAQAISLIVSIILARLLSPDDYGVVAMVMVFITIANVFVSNGFGNALIQKKNADNLDFSSVFWINIVIGILIYIVLFYTAPMIAIFYNMPMLKNILRVLGIRIIVASFNSVQQAYVSRNMLFKRFFLSTLFGTLVSGVVGVTMAYRGGGVWSLVTQYLVNTCTDTLVLWFTVKWRPDFKCSLLRARELFRFGWKLLVSGLLDTGYTQLRSLIIGKTYSASDLAYFNQGDKYPCFIVVNINASIQSVLYPAMAMNQDNREKVKQMTRRSIQVSSYLMWPLMIGFAAIAEPFVRIVLTDKWLPCVPFIRIFCLTYGLWPIHTANLQAVNALGRSDLFLKLELVKKFTGVLVILITIRYGVLVMAYGIIITDIVGMFINAYPNAGLLGYTYREQLKDLVPGLLMALVMGAIIYPLSLLDISDYVIILIQIVSGSAIYWLISVIINFGTFRYLKGLLRDFIHLKKR